MFKIKQASKSIQLMGTTIDLTITHQEPEIILSELVSLLKLYEQRFSANDDQSELNTINQQAGLAPVSVHPELFELIQIGKEHSLASNSYLNIALGPLVQTWRIGFDNARVPTDAEVQDLLKITDPNQIQLDEETHTVFLAQKGMKIDLGALAKGYIADRLLDYLAKENVQSALLNLGGNLVTFGPALNRADLLWRIGIQNPIKNRGNSQIILKVPQKSVVTSGIYERHLKNDGKTFHHIFDRETGYPIESKIASLTIVSDQSVDGEIWTTRLFGQTPEQIIKILNQIDGIDGLVITTQGATHYSTGMRPYMP